MSMTTTFTASNPNDVRIHNGSLIITTDKGEQVRLNAVLRLGGGGSPGRILLHQSDGERGTFIDGNKGNLWLGGNGQSGDVVLFSPAAEVDYKAGSHKKAVIHLVGGLRPRAILRDGELLILSGTEEPSARLKAGDGGKFYLYNVLGNATIGMAGETATVTIGHKEQRGKLRLRNDEGKTTIDLDGQAGDIVLKNGDCAEEFPMEDGIVAEPGAVMVVGDQGALKPCAKAHDTRVAGVVAGAGDLRPAIVLGREPRSSTRRLPIALMGRANCWVDATRQPVRAGDLLCTSATQGHAMRASGRLCQPGTILGKALASLGSGRGLVPTLLTLQ